MASGHLVMSLGPDYAGSVMGALGFFGANVGTSTAALNRIDNQHPRLTLTGVPTGKITS